MISRREFLSRSAAGAAWLGLGAGLSPLDGLLRSARAASGDEVVITLLHTNDVHSRIEPFPDDGSRNANMAGAARRATLVNRIRGENPHTLLLDAGDVFQGTPYFNLFEGEVDFRVMSALGYDAMTLGNHEFDTGVEALARVAREHARFAIVSANYDVAGTALEGLVRPYVIRNLGPARVGIFGLGIKLEGLVGASMFRGVTYSNPVDAARETARRLREVEKCDLVVCLSHLGNNGYAGEPGEQDVGREVAGIDFIAGGHSHTFMDSPTRVRHGDRETLIFQVGWGGIYLGRVDFRMQRGRVVEASAAAMPVDGRFRESEIGVSAEGVA